MSDLEKNKELVRTFFASRGVADYEKFMNIITPDVTFNVIGSSCFSREFTLETLPDLVKYLNRVCPEGLRFEIKELTAEEDRVSCTVDGFSKSGIYDNHYHILFRIRDGRICQAIEYMDTLLVEKVFGPMIEQDAAKQ